MFRECQHPVSASDVTEIPAAAANCRRRTIVRTTSPREESAPLAGSVAKSATSCWGILQVIRRAASGVPAGSLKTHVPENRCF